MEQDKATEAKLEGRSYSYILDKIGAIFSEIKNKVQSGYNLREIIDQIDALKKSLLHQAFSGEL